MEGRDGVDDRHSSCSTTSEQQMVDWVVWVESGTAVECSSKHNLTSSS